MQCVPPVGSLHPQYSVTVQRRLDFSNGSVNDTIPLNSFLCAILTSSWQVSARKAGRSALSPANARHFDPSSVMRKSGVGVFRVFRWAFVVREFQNMKIGPKGQLGSKSEDS